MRTPIEVKVGQVWEDCDKRMAGRKLVVEKVQGNYAHCYNQHWTSMKTRIRLDRFKPTSTGFRLAK